MHRSRSDDRTSSNTLAQVRSCVEQYLVVNHIGSMARVFELGWQNLRVAFLLVKPSITGKEPPAKDVFHQRHHVA